MVNYQVKEIEDEQIPIQRSIDKLNSHLPKVEQEISKAQEKFNDAEANVKVRTIVCVKLKY